MNPERPWADPDEIGCQLYLISPPVVDQHRFAAILDETLRTGSVAAFLLRTEPGEDEGRLAVGRALRAICHDHGAAMLIDNHVDLASAIGADGVHLEGETDIAAARSELGDDALIGASAGMSRHVAMTAGDAGADYVTFGRVDDTDNVAALADLVGWWSGLFVLPCAAAGYLRLDEASSLARAGANFIAVGSAVWDDPAGPAAAVAQLSRAIERS